ncbi:hypothetical protein [Kitasatospora purpeofusca]|uniref:hypothetical protein n=1 Tax=Kitasatospora purpeofusca TaxID=67352 RepID=UPI003864C5FC|nr:hypothetical protein OIP63_16140 [Kitasatospora purpeofusca]
MTTNHTASGLINAAGALMAALSAHPDLPTPRITSEEVVSAERDASGDLVLVWGLCFGFHRDNALSDFEQWRQAFVVDPTAVDHDSTGHHAWLSAATTYAGVPLTLTGYYTLALRDHVRAPHVDPGMPVGESGGAK